MKPALIHFGIEFYYSKYGFELKRENYALINQRSSFGDGQRYTLEWCEHHRENALINFDLNMEHINRLDEEEFEQTLDNFLKKYRGFKEIKTLKPYMHTPGYYVMVLGKYKKVYIGTTEAGIGKRIEGHWKGNKQFDRLLFPMDAVKSSVLSIDSFRALDTTRIFVYDNRKAYVFEDSIMRGFPKKFILNRIHGGRLEFSLEGLNRILNSINRLDLLDEGKTIRSKIPMYDPLVKPKSKIKRKTVKTPKQKPKNTGINKYVIMKGNRRFVSYKHLENVYGLKYKVVSPLVKRYNIEIIKKRRHYIDEEHFKNVWEKTTKIRHTLLFIWILVIVVMVIVLIFS